MWTYIKHVLIWLDQGVNVLFFLGYPDETLSARAYRHYKGGSRKWPCRLIDAILWFDKDHCKASYESEIANRQLPPEYRGR